MPAEKTKTRTLNSVSHSSREKYGLLAFGAGLAVGIGAALLFRTRSPRGAELLNSVMQKLGFEWGEIVLALWDPEAQYPLSESQESGVVSSENPPRKRPQTPKIRRRTKAKKTKMVQTVEKGSTVRRRKSRSASLEIVS